MRIYRVVTIYKDKSGRFEKLFACIDNAQAYYNALYLDCENLHFARLESLKEVFPSRSFEVEAILRSEDFIQRRQAFYASAEITVARSGNKFKNWKYLSNVNQD